MEVRTLTGVMKMVAPTNPDKIVISVRGEIELTRAQLWDRVDRAAALLVFSGVGAGDVVALAFPNTIELVILLLAVIRCRATAAPLNPAYTAEQFKICLSNSGSKHLLTPQEGNVRARSAASKLNITHLTAAKLDSADSEITLSSTDREPSLHLIFQVVNEPLDVALILHSSSAISPPKGHQLTQHCLGSLVWENKRVCQLTESDSTVVVLPLFGMHGLVVGLLSTLAAGAAVVLPAAGSFLESTFWADMISCNATWYIADAGLHCAILKRHIDKPEPAYPKLRFIMSCDGSHRSRWPQLKEAFGAPVHEDNALKDINLLPKIHQMENILRTAPNLLLRDRERNPGFVGRPMGRDTGILDEHQAIQAAGVSGEGCISGPNMTEGCENNLEANEQAFQSGGFQTGKSCPSSSNDTPEGNNAPQTTGENNTETQRGGEEGGHGLTAELEKFSGPKKFSYNELMTVIAEGKRLGGGGFGTVYKGHIGDARTPVAVKIMNSDSQQGINEYISEVETLSQLRHKNLVPLIGYCHEADKFILVYEFMSEGSLADHLFEGRPLLTWDRRYKIAQGLTWALHYLQEECSRCVIHRDIKSDNVMLDEEFKARLGDFGLARLVDHARGPKTTKLMGTDGYAAPEYLSTSKVSKETDIYSFGVVLLEIGTGREAIDGKRDSEGLVEWVRKQHERGKLLDAIDSRLPKNFEKKEAEALMMAGLWCTHPTATSRPSIEQAMAVLNLQANPPVDLLEKPQS